MMGGGEGEVAFAFGLKKGEAVDSHGASERL